ncbi:MAG: hypothetical protein OK457_05215 [Thaumarchaeota archaeon]|nr:hypothetical protein [Nitrososphaerota archaeon]
MLIENTNRAFEVPETGTYNGTIIDVVDLGKVLTQFGEKVKIRILWALNKNDSEGKPYRVMRQVTASVNEKSALYEIVKGVFGTAPPVPFDSETLIGRANTLVIVKETDAKTGKTYGNVKVILPLQAGAVPPPVPQGFTRAKDRPATLSGATAQSAAPVATPAVLAPVTQAVSQPVATPTPALTAPMPSQTTPPASQHNKVVDAAF